MNILSIGNSFSQDAQRYLHKIACSDKYELNTYNLYIGGCPLSLHFRNMLINDSVYDLEMNGQGTGFKVSLKQALLNRDWDVITFQQASTKSIDYSTYQPYLNKLVEYVREYVPKAKIVIHQTWAYEQGSDRLSSLGYNNQSDMFDDLHNAYSSAVKDIDADMVITSGFLLQKLIQSGIEKVHRDTFHASFGVGRYAIGLLWYAVLSGNDINNNSFCDFDEQVTDEEVAIVKKCINEVLGR